MKLPAYRGTNNTRNQKIVETRRAQTWCQYWQVSPRNQKIVETIKEYLTTDVLVTHATRNQKIVETATMS